MSRAYQGGKGDSNRVKDHKTYGDNFDKIFNKPKPEKVEEHDEHEEPEPTTRTRGPND